MKSIVFSYELGDEITTTVGITGKVSSLCVDHGGFCYAVEWINGQGDIKSRWFRPGEIVGKEET